MLIVAMATVLLGGCLDNGSTYAPPANFAATAGDGRVTLTWTPNWAIDYWVFSATDPSITAFNWIDLPNAHAYTIVPTPLYLCGLFMGDQYYFAANGRTSGGPGGPSSPTVSATPYDASTTSWTAGPTVSGANIYGVGYTSLFNCWNNPTTSGAGIFAMVGAGGAIYTSSDGKSWAHQAAPARFTSDLYAVTGYTTFTNQYVPWPGLPVPPPQLWVAVGAGGSSLYSTDSVNWQMGGSNASPTPCLNCTTNQDLHDITQAFGIFVAVGNAGTIMSTYDGLNWIMAANQPSSYNLWGIARGSVYVAVGEHGTILTSPDGSNWTLPLAPPATSNNLRKVAISPAGSLTGIIVAVGDQGTIVTSLNNGLNWSPVITLPGAPNLISVTVENKVFANVSSDPVLGGSAPSSEFVAMDSTGKVYTSVNGIDWSGPSPTPINNPNAMFASGFGYVAAGNGGTTAYAF
jgi:photosystem II stability/assembly factor-like uncharacterized protein